MIPVICTGPLQFKAYTEWKKIPPDAAYMIATDWDVEMYRSKFGPAHKKDVVVLHRIAGLQPALCAPAKKKRKKQQQ